MIGKGNISAKVVADSISPEGVRITTFELEYPRFIHAEFMTHRLFSRNAASSRAIPVDKAIELVKKKTAMPIHWGKNQPGMSAKEECDEKYIMPLANGNVLTLSREEMWQFASKDAIKWSERFKELGYHKQIVNRLLEPFTMIKVVCTATEYDNFFWLRRHPDAQPEIQELAEMMHQARANSNPVPLTAYEWHVPYYEDGFWIEAEDGKDVYGNTLEDALMISSSCCAQVSYRVLNDTLEKAKDIFQRLVEAKPVHASPFEHQATPFTLGTPANLENGGLTHIDSKGSYWSGNFRGWIQHRQLIKDHTCWSYEG